jgi:tRNA(fMet)-specific endonuclease VapC
VDKEITLLDTDALIEYLRKNDDVVNMINDITFENIFITPIVKAEILSKAVDRRDYARLNKALEKFTSIPIDLPVSNTFEQLIEKYTLSHHSAVPDMLIAPTSAAYNVPLFTLNKKHFQYIKEIRLIQHNINPMPRIPGSWFG